MRDALERVQLPNAEAAEERARHVVLAAFVAREPVSRPRRGRAVAIGVALAAVGLALAAASPPGMAVVDRVREVVGVERAAPALFSVPGGGRLLVTSDDGLWVVDANGKKRLLAPYGEASWSPEGRFVVATRGGNELVTLEPDGGVHWTLARPSASSPRWAGSRMDTSIAYVDRTGIRVVAGDGTNDRLVVPGAFGPIAWRPPDDRVLAYVGRNEVHVVDVENGRTLWHARMPLDPRAHTDLAWSSDGRLLLVVAGGGMRVFGPEGSLAGRIGPARADVVDAVFVPGSHRILLARTRAGQSAVTDRAGRTLFAGTGVFDEIMPSPDGRWLAVEWRTANQWVFVRNDPRRAIRAVSGIADQFGGGEAQLAGWCCGR